MIIVVVSFLRHVLIFSWHFFHLSFLPEMLFRQTLVFAMMSFSLELQKSTHATSLQASGSRRFWVLFQCYFYNLGEFYLQGHAPPVTGGSFHQRCLRCVRRTMGIGHLESRKSVNHGHWLLRFSAWHKLCFLGIPVFLHFWDKNLMWFHKGPPSPRSIQLCHMAGPWLCLALLHVICWCSTARRWHPMAIPIAAPGNVQDQDLQFWRCCFFEIPKIVFFWRCLKMFWKFPHFSTKSSYLGVHETALQVGQITIYHHILSI